MSEEGIIEQIKELTGKSLVGFVAEFEKELKDELKDIQVEVLPLYNRELNPDLRYSFFISLQLKEDWEVEYDHMNGKYIVRRKK